MDLGPGYVILLAEVFYGLCLFVYSNPEDHKIIAMAELLLNSFDFWYYFFAIMAPCGPDFHKDHLVFMVGEGPILAVKCHGSDIRYFRIDLPRFY